MNGQPFSSPISLTEFLPRNISGGLAVEWILYAVFAFWTLYTLIAIYHWIKYSHASLVAIPAIGLHLFISLVLIVYALTGNRVI